MPYSLVVRIDVYSGSKKKLRNWVHILPIVMIAVFLTNSFSLLIKALLISGHVSATHFRRRSLSVKKQHCLKQRNSKRRRTDQYIFYQLFSLSFAARKTESINSVDIALRSVKPVLFSHETVTKSSSAGVTRTVPSKSAARSPSSF